MSIDKVVVAILLGDAHVSKRGSISFNHSIDQKEYLEHKVSIMEDHGFKMRVYETDRLSYGKMRKFVRADGYVSTRSKELRNILYPQGLKIVPESYSEMFDFTDWSFIFMDDGRANVLSHTNNLINNIRIRKETEKFVNRYEICTESFDTTSNNLLMESLKGLGVESYISSRNRIIISKATSKVNFYEGINSYIVPSMNYKVSSLPTLSYKQQ